MADIVTLIFMLGRSKTFRNNLDEWIVYAIFAVIACFTLKFFTDHAFSAMLTLSASVQCMGMGLLRMHVRKQRSMAGISSRALQLYVMMYCSRLYSTLQYNGYLPVDRTGDWVYQTCDVAALILILSLLYEKHTTYAHTYETEYDSCDVIGLIVVCFLMSVFVHPELNNSRVPDVMWTLALYVESVAMVPQLYMMAKKGGHVEAMAGHYIACVFVARLLMLSFWWSSYVELQPKASDYNLPGYGVIGAQLLQVVIFGDFMWLYLKNTYLQRKLVLPTAISI